MIGQASENAYFARREETVDNLHSFDLATKVLKVNANVSPVGNGI
jgi:hypothetical protein